MNVFHIFAILGVALGLAVIALPIYIVAGWFRASPPMFCADCGTEGPTKIRTRGSLVIEIFLWLLLIIPGILYSLWRLTTKRKVCGACQSERVLPPNSPMAQKLRADLAPKIAA